MPKQSEVREQMFSLISQWQQSGLSQKAYCQQQSIKYHVFHYWYKCYRQQQPGADSSASAFVKLQITKAVAAGAVEIYFASGTRLLFHQPVSSHYLKELVS